MKITELEKILKDIKEKHGDIQVIIANRYWHNPIRRAVFSDASRDIGGHVCVRVEDNVVL